VLGVAAMRRWPASRSFRPGAKHMTPEPNPGKARKRPSAKTQGRQDATKVKVTLYLPAELEKRFAVHAIHSGMDRSEYFAEIVRTHCRRYVVSDRLKDTGDAEEEPKAEA
jgi:hypothetical protein